MGSNIVLKLPAYKVLLAQFENARKTTDISLMSHAVWEVPFCGKTPHQVTNAWIQGRIRPFINDFENSSDCFMIDDGTGLCLATGLSKLPSPKGIGPLKPCDEVLAVGYILNAGPCMIDEQTRFAEGNLFVKMKCFKFTNITGNMNCKTGDGWKAEVFDTQNAILRTLHE